MAAAGTSTLEEYSEISPYTRLGKLPLRLYLYKYTIDVTTSAQNISLGKVNICDAVSSANVDANVSGIHGESVTNVSGGNSVIGNLQAEIAEGSKNNLNDDGECQRSTVPAAGIVGMQCLEMQFGEKLEDGEESVDNRPMTDRIKCDIENDNIFLGDDLVPATVGGGAIRATMVLWTWSHTEKEHLQNPCGLRLNVTSCISDSAKEIEKSNIFLCKHFALILSREWDYIRSEHSKKWGEAPKLSKILVKPEYHKDGNLHLHALTCSDSRTRIFGALQSRLKLNHGISVFARVSKSTHPLSSLYKYLCYPTDKKPLILPGYSIGEFPRDLVDLCEKEQNKYSRKICNENGVDEFIRKYISVVKNPASFVDLMSASDPPVLDDHCSEDPILKYRFLQVQGWYVKNASRNASAHISSCYDRISRSTSITYRSMGPKEHFESFVPAECVGENCQFTDAWNVMCSLNDMRFFISYLKQWYTNSLPYGGPSFGGRPRNIVFHGQPGCGKSFLETILMYCIPEERVVALKSGSFPFDGAAEVASPLVVLSSDFRFNEKMDVQTFLLATEGKPFSVDNKGRTPSQLKYPLVFVFGSNNFTSGKGWGITDIEAAHDRFVVVNLTPIPHHMRVKNFSFCTSCVRKFIREMVFSDAKNEIPRPLGDRHAAKKPKLFLSQMTEAKSLLDSGAISPTTFQKFCDKIKKEFFEE